MEVTLLVFLSLLISAGTTRKLISHDVVLPGDYLEEEKEDTDDDEKTINGKQSPEFRLGPHYLTRQNHGEEPPLDVSDTADQLRKNTDQESYKEDVKVKVMLAVSCTTLICSFMFMLCCFIAFIKYRMKKGNFCDKFRCSREKQKPFVLFLKHGNTGPDASVSRAAENGLWDENGKNTKSETSPVTNTVVYIPQISSVPSLPSSFSDEDLNRDQN
ncbi:uncharacterized protein PRD47_000052 isoform 1-T1 [Ara ararauna]